MQNISNSSMMDIDEPMLLNESTVYDLMQDEQYSGMTVSQTMDIWSFSNDWMRLKNKISICKIAIPFQTEDDADIFSRSLNSRDEFNGEAAEAAKLLTTSRSGQGGEVKSFEIPVKKAWIAVFITILRQIWPYKIAGISFPKTQDGKFALRVESSDASVLATSWRVMKTIQETASSQGFKDNFQSLVDIQKLNIEQAKQNGSSLMISDPKLSATVNYVSIKYLDKYHAQQADSGLSYAVASTIDDDLAAQLHTVSSSSQSKILTMTLTGPFESIRMAFGVLLSKNPNKTAFEADEQSRFDQMCVPIAYDNSTSEMKHLLKMVRSSVQENEFQNVDEAIQFMKDKKFGIALSNIGSLGSMTRRTNARNAQLRNDGVENVPQDKDVESIEDYSSIKDVVEKFGESFSIENEDQIIARMAQHELATATIEGEPANDLVRRRMKLFEDIQHMPSPPKIYKYGHWICAVCTTPAQDFFWTRTKPKIYTSGPKRGQIIAYANKRTDELEALVSNGELTQEKARMYKRIRDFGYSSDHYNAPHLEEEDEDGNTINLEYDVVHDGLRLPLRCGGSTDQFFAEAYWCTAGASDVGDCGKHACHGWDDTNVPERGQWYNYNKTASGERNPYWVSMDLNNGVLYQHSRYCNGSTDKDYLLSEGDTTTDLNGRYDSSGSPTMMATNFLVEPDYSKMMNDLRRDKTIQRIRDLKRTIEVTNDGYVKFTSKEQVRACMDMFASADGYHKIILDSTHGTTDWNELFQSMNVQFLQYVKFIGSNFSTIRMFQNATVADVLHLDGLGGSTDCKSMFAEAKEANQIYGIDLDNSKCCDEMFYGVKTTHNLDLYLHGNFNLANCVSIYSMFLGSPVTSIQLNNTSKITRAQGLFKGCVRLKRFPDIRFPAGRSDTYELFGCERIEFVNDPLKLTFSISTPFKHNRKIAQEWLAQTIEFYQVGENDIKSVQKNGKNLIVIDNSCSSKLTQIVKILANDYMKGTEKYDGITFQNIENGDRLFSGVDWRRVPGSTEYTNRLLCQVFDFGSLKRAKTIFDNVDINAIQQFTGTENIENADMIFSRCYVSYLPQVSFPNAKTAYAMLRQTELDKLPDIRLSYKCQTLFNSKNMNDEEKLESLFGQMEISEIVKKLGRDRLLSLLQRMQTSIEADKVEQVNKIAAIAEDGVMTVTFQQFAELVNLETFNIDYLKEKIKVIKITSSQVQQLESKHAEFKWLPTFDMNDVENCGSMFKGAHFYQDARVDFINGQNVKSCEQMLCEARFDGDVDWIPKFLESVPNCSDFKWFMNQASCSQLILKDLKFQANQTDLYCMFASITGDICLNSISIVNENSSALNMFYNNTIFHEHAKTLEVECEGNANCMFYGSTLANYDSIIVKKTEIITQMFKKAKLQRKLLKSIDLPDAILAIEAFSEFNNGFTTIIGKLRAPNLLSGERMFSGSSIVSICVLDIPHMYDRTIRENAFDGIFENTGLQETFGANGDKYVQAVRAFEQLAAAAQHELAAQPAQPEQQQQNQEQQNNVQTNA